MSIFELQNPETLESGRPIDITPDFSLLPKMGQVGYKIEEAVAELVDNSVDAAIADIPVEITVFFGGLEKDGDATQSLEVFDNGRGMTPHEAETALVLGKSNKSELQIGQFGMGMKTACTFLGKRFVVETATEEDTMATLVVYDEEEFMRRGKWELRAYQVPKNFSHGTRIRVEQLRVNLKGHGPGRRAGNTPIERTEKLLARQHRGRLQNGDIHISVNHRALQEDKPEWDNQWNPVFQKFDFCIGEKRVYGVAGIIKANDTRQGETARGEDYGFDLIRNNRIVREYEKLGFVPHAMRRNLYGVIHLDQFPVTNNKMEFMRDTDDWLQLEKHMTHILKPILRAIEKWYEKPNGPANKENKINQDKYVLSCKQENGRDIIEWVLPPEPQPPASQDSDNTSDEQQDTGGKTTPSGDGQSQSPPPAPPTNEEDTSSDTQDNRTDSGNGFASPSGSNNNTLPHGGGQAAPPTKSASTSPSASVETGEFSGCMHAICFRHRTAKHGNNPYKSWEKIIVDGTDLVEVVTNLDHPFYPRTCASHWYLHNVAEAMAEYLIVARGLPADQLVATKDRLLIDISMLIGISAQ